MDLIEMIKERTAGGGLYASFGEIMLRLASPGYERFFQSPLLQASFGGGESNVAVSLAIQGLPSRFITALPDNDIARAARRTLRGYGVDVSKIIYKKDSRMGIYFMEKGADQRPSMVIYDREHTAISGCMPGDIDWREVLDGCCWFHVTGITPALSAAAARESLDAMNAAREAGCIVSLDLNYRGKLWRYGKKAAETMPHLAARAHLIIANEEDCQKALGIGEGIDPSAGKLREDRYAALAGAVLKAYPGAGIMAITLRESVSASHNRWSACLADGRDVIFSRKYDITDIVDRIGAGDSFSAGLIYGLSRLPNIKEALEYAAAASCLAHTIEGDCNLAAADEIAVLAGGDKSGRIKR